jgi:hypothetical protein
LTEISLEESSTAVEEKQNLKTQKTEIEKTIIDFKEKTLAESSPKAQGCIHHLGYLSERSKKEKIPDECIVCENIVQCMLKNVTG